jgi:hypothetical protein
MKQFGRDFSRYTARLAQNLGASGVDVAFDEAEVRVPGLTPVLTGRLKGGYRTVRRADGSRVLINDVSYFTIINRGRRRGFTPRGQQRVRRRKGMKVNKAAPMLGSKQAPRGMTRPVVRAIMGARPQLLRRIFDRAERVQP